MITIKIKNSKNIGDDYALFVSFPYDQKVIDTIRDLPTRYWNKDTKEWEIPVKKLQYLTDQLSNYDFDISGDFGALEDKKAEMPTGFEFKTKPFEHQIDGFNYGLKYDRWLLGDEQGLGKTKQVIDIAIAKKLQKGYKHCLIICGVNGLKWNWVNEIHTHSNEDAYILGQRTRADKTVIGSNSDKYTDICALNALQAYFIITNVETMRDERIVSEIANKCKSGEIGLVAIDEIHKCFDYNTLVTTDVGTLKIGDIVTEQINCSVLSYNEITKQTEWKRVVDWHENVIAEQLLELQFETKSGIKTIKCTKGHKFFTKNRGWVRAEDLTSYDDIQEF